MDKKSKILLLAFLVLVIAMVAFTYYKYMVKRDYVIEAQTDCDPYTEACFIWQCDPAATDESEKCTGDPEEDIWYYEIIRRNAMNVPLCDPNNEECDALVCDPLLEEDCEIILCDEETAVEQEAECNDPAEYIMNNPPEEEDLSANEAECEEGDEECEPAEDSEGSDEEVSEDDTEDTEE